MSEAPHPDVRLLESRVALLEALRDRRYRFVTPTPATHARVISRRETARDLRDALGWSLPFSRATLDREIIGVLEAANALEEHDGSLKCTLRVSSRGDDLFLHSAFPTTQHDAVFFGPDSYRFADFLDAEAPKLGSRRQIVDIGAGSGVGAIIAARHVAPQNTWFIDINSKALELAQANAWFARHTGTGIYVKSDGFSGIGSADAAAQIGATLDPANFIIDCIIANPPYIVDPAHRAYRDGGGMHGGEVSLDWARQAAARLERGGALLLYTGSAIIDGEDRLKSALFEALDGFDISYRELDPDVFGEELEREDYADVERIAVVGLVAVKR